MREALTDVRQYLLGVPNSNGLKATIEALDAALDKPAAEKEEE
jgi:hypothetical protein